MMEGKEKIAGVTFNGSVTFNGPMFDIHDNQQVTIVRQDTAPGEKSGAQAVDGVLLTKLSLCFKDEDAARRFLASIGGMDDMEIVRLVKKYSDSGLCTNSSKNLWKLLYDAGLYEAQYSNWNKRLNER
jgi:hypothetical protein